MAGTLGLRAIRVLVALAFLCIGLLSATQAKTNRELLQRKPSPANKKWPVTRKDIVVSMPVDEAHYTLARASRLWRKVKYNSPLTDTHNPK